MAYTSTGERLVPRRAERPAEDVQYPRPGDVEAEDARCPTCASRLVCVDCPWPAPARAGEANAGELVASARAVVRRLCGRPEDPVTAEERRTLLALIGYADALEREVEEMRDAASRAIATLGSGLP